MKVIAKRGDQILIQTSKDRGFIYHIDTNERFEENNVYSILGRGYWEETETKWTKEQLKEISELPITE